MRNGIHIHWLDPITRKRLRRFRGRRRAWVALWVLVCMYAVSLASELVCNDRPLYVRFRGASYFPAFRFYPEDTFLGNGKKTRTDYLRLASQPQFTADPAGLMVWAPVRCGPNTSIEPESLRDRETVIVNVSPVQRVASVNVGRDLRVVTSVSAGPFFVTNDAAVAGLHLPSFWPLDPGILARIERRFANETDCRAVSAMKSSKRGDIGAELSLPEYTPRPEGPATVRITFRESVPDSGHAWTVVFRRDGSTAGRLPTAWRALAESKRREISADAMTAFETDISRRELLAQGLVWHAEMRRKSVAWPHHPVPGHWLGIDSAGRDVLARVLYGLRTSLTFGLLLVAITMFLGALVGATQGFYGGAADITGQRLIETWSALPFLYIMILMGSVFGRSFGLLLLCYAAFNWIGISYYMRAEFLRLRNQPFVDAARCLGIPDHKIMARHIMPNALTPLITFFPFYLVGAIGSLAALDYLGFGMPPPTPSWGELLSQAQQFRWAWWLILYPSLALFSVMVLGVFVGEGVRDAFDPRPFTGMESS